jgi:hypothetical protein
MKVTRNQLKSIVKECLVEILAEGVGHSMPRLNESTKKPIRKIQSNEGLPVYQSKSTSNALKEAIRIESGGNDIMASILADTAEKTLPSMLENDRRKTPAVTGKIENLVASHNPEELFGEEAASKWASLAFTEPTKK